MILKKMYKLVKHYFIFFCIFLTIILILFTTLSNVLGYYDQSKKYNKLYSDNAVELSATGGFEYITMKNFLDFSKSKGQFLSCTLMPKYNDNIVSGLYLGDKNQVNIPLISGREFSQEDYDLGSNVALVKDTVVSELKKYSEVNNNYYINYCGRDYKVVGIIDSEKCSIPNDIYINIFSILDNPNFDTSLRTYTFIYDSNELTKDDIKELSDIYSKVNFNISDLKKGEDILFDSININKVYIIATVLLLIVCILTIINISTYCINSEKREYGIRKLLGADNVKLTIFLFNRYIAIAITAMLSGFTFFEILKKSNILKFIIYMNTSFSVDLITLIVVSAILLLITIIVFIPTIIKVWKLEIATIIRGGN